MHLESLVFGAIAGWGERKQGKWDLLAVSLPLPACVWWFQEYAVQRNNISATFPSQYAVCKQQEVEYEASSFQEMLTTLLLGGTLLWVYKIEVHIQCLLFHLFFTWGLNAHLILFIQGHSAHNTKCAWFFFYLQVTFKWSCKSKCKLHLLLSSVSAEECNAQGKSVSGLTCGRRVGNP